MNAAVRNPKSRNQFIWEKLTIEDTGSKPYVCNECFRPFARQDALTRHEKLHTRASNPNQGPKAPTPVSQSSSIEHFSSWDPSNTSEIPPITPSASAQTMGVPRAPQHSELNHAASDLDFDLIWPDSENLFQSIMSSDTTDQWQMPLGTLPFPPLVQDVSGLTFGSPNSFDHRSPSIGTIPSGGSHEAVRDVTEMVTSSVSLRSAYCRL